MAQTDVGDARLSGRVAIITGGASGIGAETVRLFAREGATVVMVDRDSKRGNALVSRIRSDGGECVFVEADLTQEDDCKRATQTTIELFGGIDILVNNAGGFVKALLHETSTEDMEYLTRINLYSAVWMCKYTLPYMLMRRKGVICTTASKTGLVAQRDSPLYCATKAAVIRLMQAIALDHAEEGIRANAICPGIIETPMLENSIQLAPDPEEFRRWNELAQPMGRLGTPLECAYATLFLCSDESSFITGVALPVDGGFTAM